MEKHGKAALLFVVCVIAVAALAACDTNSQCPPATEGFSIGYALEREIRNAIKAQLSDPDSYKEYRVFGRRAYVQTRENGQEYFKRLEVEFGARNAFGGMVRGRATVDLREGAEGCRVTGATIYES